MTIRFRRFLVNPLSMRFIHLWFWQTKREKTERNWEKIKKKEDDLRNNNGNEENSKAIWFHNMHAV